MAQPYVNAGMSPASLSKPRAPAKAAPKAPTKKAPSARPSDPYANPQRYIDQAVGRLGAPLTDAQIQTNVQGQLSPLVQQLTAALGRQSQAGSAAIGGYTSELAKSLAPFAGSAKDIYSGGEQSQAASDAALSQKLSGEGGQQAQDLGARLASINAPGAVNAAVAQGTQDATGSGNALYATGSASLANLIAQGAAEQSYAGKLPGIADLSGIQQAGGLQSQLAESLASGTGKIQAEAPGLVSGLQSDRSALLGRKEALRGDLASFFDTRAAKQQALKQEREALHLPDSGLSGHVGYVVDKQGNPVLGTNGQPQVLPGYHVTPSGTVAKDVKPKAPAKPPAPPKVNTTLSAANGYLTDNSGNPVLKNGKKQPYTPPSSSKSPKNSVYTKAQLNKFNSDAGAVIQAAHTAKHQPSAQSVLEQMLKNHVPIAIAAKHMKAMYPNYNAFTQATTVP